MYFLYCLFWMIFARLTRTEMGFLVSEKGIHLAPHADAKCWFKKHKYETETTHNQIKHSSNFENIDDDNHGKWHNPTYCPCEAFLGCSSIFWDLSSYRYAPEYHTWSKAGIHKEPYREIEEKYNDKDFENFIVSDEKSIHKGYYGTDKKYTSRSTYFSFVKNGDIITVDFFTKGEEGVFHSVFYSVAEVRNIFSIVRPFASSSTSLSRYLTCCVRGFEMSSILYPQIVPVMSFAFGFNAASWKKVSKVTFLSSISCIFLLSKPVSHCMTSWSSFLVLHFFSTFNT